MLPVRVKAASVPSNIFALKGSDGTVSDDIARDAASTNRQIHIVDYARAAARGSAEHKRQNGEARSRKYHRKIP